MIDKVVIVGGGTAGWMTATYLKKTFGDRISVTVVESGRVGVIGVGEATFSTIRHFLSYLGLAEQEWMPECNATYKLAIRFENWSEPGQHFYHPFERLPKIDGFSLADWWQVRGVRGRFDDDSFVVSALCDAKRSPRYADGRLFWELGPETAYVRGRTTLSEQVTQFPYAYHFDAALFSAFLMRLGERQGIRRIVDDVVDVRCDERGWIDAIRTKEHGELSGDLYVDCTGFRSILLGQALGEPFISFSDSLPNDRAVALRVPTNPGRDGIAPYTTATAQEAGWIWNIPLFERNGTGYVYSSEFCDPETAEQTLREFVGPAARDLEANHIRMRVGRSRNSWVRNCVAVGLASGFVEPLESTGIFFIQHAVEQLVKHFPDERWDDSLRKRYNRLITGCIDGIHEFLALHYYASKRTDTQYWQAAKKRDVPPPLMERIQEWQACLPDTDSIWPYFHGFEPYSYVAILLGLGGIPTHGRPGLSMMSSALAEDTFMNIREQGRQLSAALPGHYDYLAGLRGESSAAAVAAEPGDPVKSGGHG